MRYPNSVTRDLPASLLEHANYSAWLKGLEGYENQIAAFSFFPPRAHGERVQYQGQFAELLRHLHITPYKHQAESLLFTEMKQNVVVATPTASGKSLTYQLPTLHAMQNGKTALYLFPTKALSHDQLEKLQRLAKPFDLSDKISPYDGDTSTDKRDAIRKNALCLLTNPDMLHYGILPYHHKWAHFFSELQYLIVDEMHSYRGIMGTHVANVLRRFLRIAKHYGATPQIIAASATIANPAEHAKNLTGVDFVAVSEDFGPRAARELVFWQPPLISEKGDGRRRSANSEGAWLATKFAKVGLKSIFFCNSRKSAELLRRYASNGLEDHEKHFVQSYRAGYTASDRREIEEKFKSGAIRVLTATSALELGVDVGGVDAVVMVGYPGSMTAFWQRAGRAGRGQTRSLTVLIAGDDPLDEYYLNHPDLITEGKVEKAVADAFNTEIHPLHVACAAAEKPIPEGDAMVAPWLEPQPNSQLGKRNGKWIYYGRYPHKNVAVRGTGGKSITLKDGFGKTIGISDFASALRELHPGAVYLHQGDNFLVRDLDLKAGVATLLPHIEDYYTQTRSITDIEILQHEFQLYGVNVGRVRVSTEYTSFVKKRYYSEAILEERLLDLPDVSYATQALWFNVSEVAFAVPKQDLASAMHALEHTLIGLLPAFVLCERADVGGVSYPVYPATGEPLIFIYDGYPGGVGYARGGTSEFPSWLKAALELLKDCPCKTGCPRCVLSPKCGNGNQYLDKHAAKVLASELLERLNKVQRVVN
jgi:DEAD/DEAH box helicase domain-containing protein